MPFEQKSLGITSCFALYLAKNNAPVHAFFISFLSLKRYYSIILFIILGAWSQGIKRGYVSIVICTCESRLSHARAECLNLYQSISNSCIPVSQKTDQESASSDCIVLFFLHNIFFLSELYWSAHRYGDRDWGSPHPQALR